MVSLTEKKSIETILYHRFHIEIFLIKHSESFTSKSLSNSLRLRFQPVGLTGRRVASGSESGQGGFILLGPAEEEVRPFFTRNLHVEGIEILFAPEQEQLQSILSQAPLYVGHDSGITHLAAMLGTPTIALFKNSPVHQWRPLGPAVRVIENEENRKALIARTLEEASELMKIEKHGS